MFFVLMTIIANTTMIFVLRYSESHSGNRYAVTLFNYIIGVMISWVLMQERVLWLPTKAGLFAVIFGAVNAIFMTGCLLASQQCIAKNGAPLTTTFNRLGILIPTVLSAILFNEMPTIVKFIGLSIAVAAIFYISGGKGEMQNIRDFPSLLAVFAIGGIIDFNSKVFSIFGEQQLQEYFVFWTFIFNMVYSLVLLMKKNRKIEKKDMVSGIMVGIPNQLITFCIVKAASQLPAYLVFPVYSAGVIMAVNIINYLIFREKLSKRESFATLLIGVALILINL